MDLVKEVRNTVLEVLEKEDAETNEEEEDNGLIGTDDTVDRLAIFS